MAYTGSGPATIFLLKARWGAVSVSYSIRILGSSANFSDRFLDQKYERGHLIHFQKCYEYINFSNVQT